MDGLDDPVDLGGREEWFVLAESFVVDRATTMERRVNRVRFTSTAQTPRRGISFAVEDPMIPTKPTSVVVTAASGSVGREAVFALLKRKIPVRAADRSIEELRSIFGEEVPLVRLDFGDATSFDSAFEGASSIFLVRPPPITDVKSAMIPFVDAALRKKIRHIVFLSAAGLGDSRLLPHYVVEQYLRAKFDGYTFLRPGFFTQHLGGVYRDDIVRDGKLFVPAAHGRVAFVDMRDVAEIAANIFADPEVHYKRVYTLTGPEAVTFAEVAELLSEVLGRDVHYEPASVVSYVRHLHDQGVPLAKVAVQTVLHVGLRFGQAERVDPTLERLLGRRGHTVERYVRDFDHLWAPRERSNVAP